MKKLVCVLMMLLALGISTASMGSFISYGAAARDFTLYGSASGGWGFTVASISSPGPTIVVEQGDTVSLTLISNDGVTHRFFVSYANSSSPSASDPESDDFSGTISFQFVATTTLGTYKYYCFYHPAVMWGYFQVVQSGAIPEFQPLMMLPLLAAITVVAVLFHRKNRCIQQSIPS
jgi:plastocyanin